MIGGYVLDTAAIKAFGQGDIETMLAIETVDLASSAILIPMTAMTEALAHLDSEREARDALELLEFGVTVDSDLTRENAELVAITNQEAADEVSLGMAHTATEARERGWPVFTIAFKDWERAYPDIEIAPASYSA